MKKILCPEFPAALFIILTGALLSYFFKTIHQITFVSPDELLWMLRSNIFMERFLNGDFSGLIQSSQPGVMVMWLVGPAMYLSQFNFELITNLLDDLNQAGIPYNVINSNDSVYYQPYQKLSFLFNLPLLAVLFIFTLCFYFSLRKLKFSKIKSLTALSFLASSSCYFLFFVTPADKLLTVFMTLSLFGLLIYCDKNHGNSCQSFLPREGLGVGFSANLTHLQPLPKMRLLILNRKKFLIASAVLAAWAALTKLSALFLLPFSLLVLIIYKYKNVRSIIKDYSLWIIIFLITSVIFLPTIITNSETAINLLLNNTQDRLIINSPNIDNSSPFLFIAIILTYLSDSSLISLGPLALICLTMFFIFTLVKVSLRAERGNFVAITQRARLQNYFTFYRNSKNIFVLILYLFLFFIFITLFSKTYSFRYLAPLFPIIYLLAGIGLVNLVDLIIKKFHIPKKLAYFEMIMLIFLSQLLFIFTSRIEKIEILPDFH